MTDLVGQQVGTYRLLRLLGHGGFADVYLGEHIHLKTQAAIKILHSQMAAKELEDFRREAQMIAHLSHPHIVRVSHFDIDARGLPFLVMDYLPNGNILKLHPRGQRIPLPNMLSYSEPNWFLYES
jgi:eukaryotic-like serine/threonine-protein kinase